MLIENPSPRNTTHSDKQKAKAAKSEVIASDPSQTKHPAKAYAEIRAIPACSDLRAVVCPPIRVS